MLAMLRRIAAVNQGMLLNSHSRICNSQCNSEMLSQDFYANKEIKTFSWEKMSPFPTLPFCMKISRQVKEILLLCSRLDQLHFWEIFRGFWSHN
jgi:hypothetical protein